LSFQLLIIVIFCIVIFFIVIWVTSQPTPSQPTRPSLDLRSPSAEAAVEILRQKAEELKKVTISIVESRIAEENIVATCQNVVIAGKCFFF
jgi:beta-lactam-binding protein with PASTA domain